MLNLAPWYYRNLLVPNEFINSPEYYELTFLNNKKQYEANVFLKSHLRPSWVSRSNLYKNSDGTGTSTYKNIAVYKAISEALERLAFYELAESNKEKEYFFDLNPTTTGMAAYPHWLTMYARNNAIVEAVERWCIHEFNRGKIPSIEIPTLIANLNHYELVTPFKNVKVSLLKYAHKDFYTFAFAGGRSLTTSFDKALIELQRNIKVLEKYHRVDLPLTFIISQR
jgi:hypothetical protein